MGILLNAELMLKIQIKNLGQALGKITGLLLPGGNGIRIDTAIYEGYTIPPNYDSMIMKIITFGSTRNEAISRMKRALEELVVEGIETNRDFLFEIIKNPDFIRGDFDTSFINKKFKIQQWMWHRWLLIIVFDKLNERNGTKYDRR